MVLLTIPFRLSTNCKLAQVPQIRSVASDHYSLSMWAGVTGRSWGAWVGLR